MKACIYTRVSTAEQATEGYSIEEQERRCRASIESKGWDFAGTYSDPGISGRTMERPGLKDMLAAIRAREVDAVVIYKLDRLSRKQRDTMFIIEDVFLKNNITLVSLNETLDTSTPWGRAMIGILSSFNQMESENIQMRTSMGREAKAKSGGYAGGKPAIGYRVWNGELEVDPAEAQIVRDIYDMRYNQDMTLANIAARLNEDGVKTKRGSAFYASTVREILSNEELYRGHYAYGKTSVKNQHSPIIHDGEFMHD